MARARRNFSRPSRATRLSKFWSRQSLSGTVVSTTQSALAASVITEGVQDVTLLRARGDFLVVAIPDAASDNDVLAMGLIVANQSAITAGGVSLPGPILDQDSDAWLWHSYVGLDAVTATAGTDVEGSLIARVHLDSKAMRKVQADQGVVLMAELVGGAFAAVEVSGGCAFLFGV